MRAARAAREELSEAVSVLHGEQGTEPLWLEEDVSRVVRRLFAAETASAERVVGTLGEAMEMLRAVLVRLQSIASGEGALGRVTESVARTLAVLYPLRAELERPSVPADDGEPIPLIRRRQPERRADDRLSIDADIGLASDSNFYTGFTSDLSKGGIFVATDDVLPVGTELMVSFVLPGGHHVTTTGHVGWVRALPGRADGPPPGMGIAFDGLSKDDHDAILRFIADRPPLFHDE